MVSARDDDDDVSSSSSFASPPPRPVAAPLSFSGVIQNLRIGLGIRRDHSRKVDAAHAAMLRRSRGKLEHGGADVCESGGCLVLVLVLVIVSFKSLIFFTFLFGFSQIFYIDDFSVIDT